jgi:threonine dehydratase
MIELTLPTFADIEDARRRLKGEAVVTPLLESSLLNEAMGGRILIKPECLQRTGSFKFRGAWNFISRLGEEASRGGVVAYSSGNHAQGVAAAARLRKLPAVIVMPEDTPEIKLANTWAYGAEIVTYDRASQSREEIAIRLAQERGAIIVPPYEHRHIIAGQGTAGLELVEQAAAMGLSLDALLTPVGGGGLTAGLALAMAGASPTTAVHCVEPDGFDDYRRSLASGRRERNPAASGSICDALMAQQPGELTFAVNRRLVGAGFAVSEDEVCHAMRQAFSLLKLVVEPGGAVALAAVLAGRIETAGRTIGVMLSGGNVDPGLYSEVLKSGSLSEVTYAGPCKD